MSSTWIILSIVGAVIIVALAVVAGILQYKVHKLNQARKAQESALQAESDAQRERSIQVIAHAVGSDDITLTEASIRISVLLDSLGIEDEVREEFSAFYELKGATEHIPFLDAWKTLSKKEKFRYDRERTTQEQFHEKAVVDAAKRIRGRNF